jgi:signal transduction histidine kinase
MLLLLAAAVMVPPAILAGPDGRPDVPVLVGLAMAAVAAGVASHLGARADAAVREVLGLTLVAVAATIFLWLVARSSLSTFHFLGAAAALTVSMAAIRRTPYRWGLQTLTLLGVAALLLRGRDQLIDLRNVLVVGGPMLLLVAVTVLASALAGDLERARRRDASARIAADRRTALLASVRSVAGTPATAVRACVDALRGLGFDAAVVRRRTGGGLRRTHASSDTELAGDELVDGLSARALRQRRTLVTADYRADPRAGSGADLGGFVVAPIVVEGEGWGTLAAGRREASIPTVDEVETVEVMAQSLGATVATERRLANQTAVLARLRQLEALRGGFVASISDDLRDPLAVVQTAARTLAVHGDVLDADQRHEVLGQLTAHAEALNATFEILLDSSRVQAAHGPTRPETVDVVDLVEDRLPDVTVALAADGPLRAVVDPALLRHGLGLLETVGLDPTRAVAFDRRDALVVVDVPLVVDGGLAARFARVLADRLFVGAGARVDHRADGVVLQLPRARPRGRT